MATSPTSGPGGGGTQLVDVATVLVTPAEIKNLFTVYKTLVAAPGAGQMLLPLAVTLSLAYATTDYTDPLGADIQVVWAPGTNTAWDIGVGLFNASSSVEAYMIGNLAGGPSGRIVKGAVEDQALQLANFGGGDLAAGDSPVTATTHYLAVDI